MLSTSFIIFEDLIIFHFVFNKEFLAYSGFFDDLIIFITLSIFSTLTDNPINICALSSDFFRSYLVFLITTFSLNLRKFSKKSFRLQVFGLLSRLLDY